MHAGLPQRAEGAREGQPWLPGAPLSGVEVLGREEEALSWPRLYGSNGCMAHGEGGTIAGSGATAAARAVEAPDASGATRQRDLLE